MRRSASVVLAVSVALCGWVALQPITSAVSVDCTFTPVIPPRVSVGQNVVGLRTPLSVTDTSGAGDCASGYSASVSLVHGSDSYYLYWNDDRPTDTQSVYDYEIVPGTYTTAGDEQCSAYSADYSATYTCAVQSAQTVIKYSGINDLGIKRLTGKDASKILVTVRTRRYDSYSPTYLSTRIAIQQLNSAGAWVTIMRGTTNGSHGYVWTHYAPKAATYRVVSAESASAFAAVSYSAKR